MKRCFIIVIFLIFFAGCATFRPMVHEGARSDYYSRYVSDTNDSIQQLALYEKSMTFELITLSKSILDIRANLIYFYGYYEITEANDLVFYIFARNSTNLRLLQNSEQGQASENGPVVQRYQILKINSKMLRLKSNLSNPLFHLFFGPIEDGRPPTIFTEV